MRVQNVVALCAGACLFFWAGASAQEISNPQSASTQTSSAAKNKKAGKEKKWHGKLVDANCMTETMNTTSAPAAYPPGPEVPHFAGNSSEPGQVGGSAQQQMPSSGGQGSPYPNQQQPNAQTGAPGEGPTMGPESSPQEQRAVLLGKAIRKCAATASTSEFGLATSGGEIIRFGQEANREASEAIKQANLKPDKPVKAIAKGTEDGGSVQITSVEIKSKHKK